MVLNLPLSFPLLPCDSIGIGYGRQFSFEMGFGARLDGVSPRSLTFSTRLLFGRLFGSSGWTFSRRIGFPDSLPGGLINYSLCLAARRP